MTITSFYFLCFICLGALIYYILPKRFGWIIMLVMSFAYYILAQSLQALIYPLASVVTIYLCARVMEASDKKSTKKLMLWLGCIISLGLLIMVKYIPRSLLGVNEGDGGILRLVPIGISFYTFSLLGYLFDVYYEMGKAEHNLAKLTCFGIFFPNMTSGPIMRYSDISQSMFAGHVFSYKDFTRGCQRILWGFFEKLVLAERCARIADEVFNNYESYNGLYIILAFIAFTLQLYTDFVGCMDIVIGTAELFGIKMPENFRRPFMSETIQEFWQRWHMTLGNWLKNYLFYPLLRTEVFMKLPKLLKDKVGKKAAKKISTYLAMLILWTVIGTWHGGAWHYIIGVGILQWIYIILEDLLDPVLLGAFDKAGLGKDSAFVKGLRRVRVFILMTLAFAMFRAARLTDMFKMTGRIFSKAGWKLSLTDGLLIGMEWYEWILLIISLAVFVAIQLINEKKEAYDIRQAIGDKKLPLRWLIWIGLIMWVILLGWYGPGFDAAEFIYQGF